MALVLVKVDQTCRLVHSDDPAVGAPEGVDGWHVQEPIPSDATYITIRALNAWEMLEAQQNAGKDIEETQVPLIRFVLDRGLIDIDGDKKKARQFIKSPDVQQLMDVFYAIMQAGSAPFSLGQD